MRTKLLCLVFLFVLLAVSVFAASPSLGTFKRGSCVDLKQTCASCSYVNFTRVSYPNGSVALENVQAEKRGYVFNYTFCNTDALGTYLVEGVGDVNGEDTVFVYDFEITETGFSQETQVYINAFVFLILLLTTIMFVVGAYFDIRVLTIFAGFLYIALGIFSFISPLPFIPPLLTEFIKFILLGLGVYIIIYETTDWIRG